ncbi:hypothetical protein DPEC_G00375390 [Dallia pectoralis]|nr:hypothetical protein DPEC_G00375390 [Dallia pectoralis]
MPSRDGLELEPDVDGDWSRKSDRGPDWLRETDGAKRKGFEQSTPRCSFREAGCPAHLPSRPEDTWHLVLVQPLADGSAS